MDSNLSPLAVVLSDFSTTCADEYTHIRWTTASEQKFRLLHSWNTAVMEVT
ncbi:MAG: hypothetical protein R2779_05920 [Crocinitomicaceae bacterium]